MVHERNNRIPCLILGICGGSCSGKTTLVQHIASSLSSMPVSLLGQDSYYKDLSHLQTHEREKMNFDHPDAFDIELLFKHLVDLKRGLPVEKPVYDFVSHTRKDEYIIVEPWQLIVVEGILTFYYPSILQMLDLKIFIEVDDDIRLVRRIKRDVQERGRTIESVLSQYMQSVKPMHERYVRPLCKCADIVITQEHFNSGLKETIHLIKNRMEENGPGNSQNLFPG